MNRRGFLKSVTTGMALSAIPVSVLGFVTTNVTKDFLSFDIDRKTISWVANTEKRITVNDLYTTMKKLWKNEDDLIRYSFPIIANTPEYVEMVDDWSLDDTMLDHLYGGSILNKEETWLGVSLIGYPVKKDMSVFLYRDDKPKGIKVHTNNFLIKDSIGIKRLTIKQVNTAYNYSHIDTYINKYKGTTHLPFLPSTNRI